MILQILPNRQVNHRLDSMLQKFFLGTDARQHENLIVDPINFKKGFINLEHLLSLQLSTISLHQISELDPIPGEILWHQQRG